MRHLPGGETPERWGHRRLIMRRVFGLTLEFRNPDVTKTKVIDPWLRVMSSVSCHAILWGGTTGELLIVSGEETRQVFLCRLASPAW